jgi:hypothetical protein
LQVQCHEAQQQRNQTFHVRLEPGCVKIEKTQSLFLILANGERAIIAFLKEKLGVM